MINDRMKRLVHLVWRPERASTSIVIFGLLAIMLTALVYLTTSSYLRQDNVSDTLMQRSETLRTLRAATESAINAETGQRGYLLTGDTAYLAPFRQAEQEWPSLLDRLQDRDTSSGEDRDDILSVLKKLQEAKLAEMNRTIDLYDSGDLEAAIEMVRSNRGKLLMDDYRLMSGRYEAELSKTLAEDQLVLDLGRGRPFILLGALFLAIMIMLIIGYVLERRRATAENRLEQARELSEAHERTALLARELNHRVNNLFSIVLAIVSLAARRHDDKDRMITDIRERIHALSRAHSVARDGPEGVIVLPLDKLLKTVLQPYLDQQGNRVILSDARIQLPTRAITPLGLILHELATNAAKYGALSTENGTLEVTAEMKKSDDEEGTRCVHLCWSEHGAEVELGHEGFGTTMMHAAAKQLHGKIMIDPRKDGMRVELNFPAE